MQHKSYSLLPRFRAETFSPRELEQLTAILRQYQVESVKFTSSGRLRISGIAGRELDAIADALQPLSSSPATAWITTLQVCPGKDSCRFGTRDGETLAARIEAITLEVAPPAKIKIGIAGCSMCCTEPFVRDIGLLAGQKGWKLLFGGNAAGRPRIADIIADGLDDDATIELVTRCLTVYVENARPKMRTARFMESFGVEEFRRQVLGEQGSTTSRE